MKKSPQQPNKKKRFKSIKEETAHYDAILLEEVRDQFRFVTEKVGSLQESFDTKLTEVEETLKREISDTRNALAIRIDVVEVELKREITRTRSDLSSLKKDVANLDAKVDGLKSNLTQKIDRVSETVTRHDEQIASLAGV